ncbi:MAG: hypothetical protein PHX18_07735 [Candidatus Gastranaerophilales bacterium]|nr:hypothetical protein [Candidatus Gastranaerophilales bacterium]
MGSNLFQPNSAIFNNQLLQENLNNPLSPYYVGNAMGAGYGNYGYNTNFLGGTRLATPPSVDTYGAVNRAVEKRSKLEMFLIGGAVAVTAFLLRHKIPLIGPLLKKIKL